MRLVNGYSEVVYYNLAATGGTEALHKLGRASKALYRSHMVRHPAHLHPNALS